MAQKLKILTLLLLLLSSSIGIAQAVDYTQDVNCIAAWLMDIDEDPITDSSGNGNTGALAAAGEPNFTTAGKFNGCYDWDDTGNGDYIAVGNYNLAAGFSTCGWLWSTKSTTDDALFAHNSTGSNLLQIWRDENGASDRFGVALYDGTFGVRYGTTNPSVDTWYHISVTYNGTTAKLYINGSQEGADLTAGMTSSSVAYTLGNENTASTAKNHDGLIDDFGLFSDVLTSTEINDIMDNGLVGAVAATFTPKIMFF